ncbi:MAG: hypothetical protein K9K67_14950 [Bacteriovoracaceae bacterium]|nr:hypothetical protein [Bacteriovoracaceae bacterium]
MDMKTSILEYISQANKTDKISMIRRICRLNQNTNRESMYDCEIQLANGSFIRLIPLDLTKDNQLVASDTQMQRIMFIEALNISFISFESNEKLIASVCGIIPPPSQDEIPGGLALKRFLQEVEALLIPSPKISFTDPIDASEDDMKKFMYNLKIAGKSLIEVYQYFGKETVEKEGLRKISNIRFAGKKGQVLSGALSGDTLDIQIDYTNFSANLTDQLINLFNDTL